MTCELPIKCVSKNLCANCEFMELDIDRMLLSYDDKIINVNEIKCKNYELCTKMLRYLNLNADDTTTEKDKLKYIGRDGD